MYENGHVAAAGAFAEASARIWVDGGARACGCGRGRVRVRAANTEHGCETHGGRARTHVHVGAGRRTQKACGRGTGHRRESHAGADTKICAG
jgi:hypothetical protein